MRWFLLLLGIALSAGCTHTDVLARGQAESDLFGPSTLVFHPFTAVKSWTGDEKPDGVEAMVEFQDQFGDPTKAAGTFVFELYQYRVADPDPRGNRLAVWRASVASLSEQYERWNRISRTYAFPLEYADVAAGRSYVLTATFESASGGRLFARTILEGQPEDNARAQPAPPPPPASSPATGPGR